MHLRNYYVEFDLNYNKLSLLELYFSHEKKESGPYSHVDPAEIINEKPIVEILDKFNFLVEEFSVRDFGLSKLNKNTGLHINPRNNGIIVFPLFGSMAFDFNGNTAITIKKPTVVNGKQMHRYYPVSPPAIFFGIKIPQTKSWEYTLENLPHD